MENYRDLGGDSNVAGYMTGTDWIEVVFKTGTCRAYTYTYRSAGEAAVEQMKRLATYGKGLNSYIKLSKPSFASKC